MFGPRKGLTAMNQWTPPIVRPGSIAPKPKRGMFGELPQPEKVKGANWADGLGVLGAMLRDLDGTMGSDNTAQAKAAWDAHVAQQEEKARQVQAERIRKMAALGDPTAMAYLDPIGNRAFMAGREDRAQDVEHRNRAFDANRADRAEDVQYRDRAFDAGRADRAEDVEHRNRVFDRGVFESDRTFDEGKRQFGLSYGLKQDELALAQAEAERKASRTPGSLHGLPAGVQSAIVRDQLDKIEAASSASDQAEKAANLAKQFMAEAEGYHALGGGPLADIGQWASQRTARLEGITAEMIPLMRQAGEGIMTDADAKRYESAVSSINKGRKANQSVADALEAGKQNAQAYESWLREFVADGGYGDQQTAELIWDEYQKENPVFGEDGNPVMNRIPIRDWLAIKQEQAAIDDEIARLEAEEAGQ